MALLAIESGGTRWHGHLALGIFRCAGWMARVAARTRLQSDDPPPGRPSHSRSMNPWLLFCLAILLLSIPGFPRGSSRAGRDVAPMPEMPRSAGRPAPGLPALLRPLASAPDRPMGTAAGDRAGDPDLESHLRDRPHAAPVREPPAAGLHDRPRVLRRRHGCTGSARSSAASRSIATAATWPRSGRGCGRWGRAASCRSSRRARSCRPRAGGSAR